MKININKNLRITLVIMTVVLLCTISFLFFKQIKNPDFEEEKISLFSYNQKSGANYEVFLKPNILYKTESIGEGNIYITEFIDHIKTTLHYEFSGEKTSHINGDYEIISEVEGYTGQGENYVSIWKKKFQLLPKKTFDVKDKTLSIKEDIILKLEDYNDFAKKVMEDSKINSQVKLTVSMNVNLKAQTDQGIIEEKMSPTMVMPLNNNYFEITGNLSEDKPGSVETTKQVPLPINKKKAMLYSGIIGILLMILSFLVFFTTPVTFVDPLEKKLKKIFKDHGDRLVALNSEIAVTCENENRVKSMDDLVRIADEIGRPIMYKYSNDFKDMTEFYVFDDSKMYILDLKGMTEERKAEKQI